ncbi:MAG: hypothetical protein NC819_00055 [Candidatus Omnitrophica bacterium]|nr:hypothetical protein [Candidatus Omnitrophota bacterium]
MNSFLFRLYLTNAIFLILHEVDAAYWQEWRLFGLPGGVDGFLLFHVPLLFIILRGLIEVSRGSSVGSLVSFFLSGCGLVAVVIHVFFLAKGGTEFSTPISLAILAGIGITSLIQASAAASAGRTGRER